MEEKKKKLNVSFPSVAFNKSFTFTDTAIIYGNEEMPYSEISQITLLATPSIITNGVAQFAYKGKVKTLAYKFGDRERFSQTYQIVKRLIEEAHGVNKNYKYLLQAHTGSSLEVYEDYIIISFMKIGTVGTGISNILKGGANGGKRINISDITSIQFKQPAGVSVGFIQFAYPGSVENKGGITNSFSDENSIPVSPQNLVLARTIVEYIENRRKELKDTSATTIKQELSSADEIKKYKELADSGVITQEEFEKKKKQLLNL